MIFRRGKRIRSGGGGYLRKRVLLIGTAVFYGALIVFQSNGYSDWVANGVLSPSRSSAVGLIKRSNTGSAHTAGSTGMAGGKQTAKPAQITTTTTNQSCAVFPPAHVGLADATSPELRKLAQYESVCQGAVAAASSFFVPTPDTAAAAPSYASDVIDLLKEYAHYGVRPLVFLEPNTDAGDVLDLNKYQNGGYDAALDTYFADIKAAGVTDDMMGTWVPFPEGNLPVWNNTDPNIFEANVLKTVGFQKKYFPNSKASILLDSESYAPSAIWGQGSYSSLLPYVKDIPKGLLDSFGLQGFPWSPPDGQDGAVFDPKVYLRIDLAAEAAKALGVPEIWFNTGTFGAAYTQSPAQTVTVSSAERQVMLGGVITQAKALKNQGFQVAVHLFAQDKSATDEAIDWSYWHQPGDGPNTAVFSSFAYELHTADIPLWLFDTYDN